MLGGSVPVAFIRFVISLGGVMLLFSQMSHPRFCRRWTVIGYALFGIVFTVISCVWYVLNRESYVRLAVMVMFLCFSIFAVFMSGSRVFLTVYKLALTYYLLAVFVIGGIEVSVLLFNRNVWADIITRLVLILAMAYIIARYVRSSMHSFDDYVENELDNASVAVMVISLLFGIGFIFNPTIIGQQTPYRLFQIFMNFFLTGALQLLVFRLYLHIGKEKEYRRENQYMKLNHRLLERQMEFLEESVESGRRIRHDVRHHNAVIAEYARNGQNEELLQYLNEYKQETDLPAMEVICANNAVNNILLAYTKKARREQIDVRLDVELGKDPGIPGIDLVTVLANAYENAIYGCMEVKKQARERACFIHLMLRVKKNKLVISCRNSCRCEIEIKNGRPKPSDTGGVGVLSIIRIADHYDGEYDFKNENGVFVFRLIMNIPQEEPISFPNSGGVKQTRLFSRKVNQ